MNPTERRRAPRARDYHLIAYTHYDEHGTVDDEGIARTLDVSAKGLQLEMPTPMLPGSRLVLKMQVREDILDLQGRVVHSDRLPTGRFRVGLSLQGVPQALVAQIEWQLGLQTIVIQAVEQLGATGGSILLCRPGSHDLQTALSYGLELDSAALQECESLAAKVLTNARSSMVPEPHACIATPIFDASPPPDTRTLGILVLVSDTPHTFSADDVALLERSALRLSTALAKHPSDIYA